MPWTPHLECVRVSANGTFISLPSVCSGMSRPRRWDTPSLFSVFCNAGVALCPTHVGCTLHLFLVLPDRALTYGADFLIRAALTLSRGYVDRTGQASPQNLCKCEAALGGSHISNLLLSNKLPPILSDLKQQTSVVSQFLWVRPLGVVELVSGSRSHRQQSRCRSGLQPHPRTPRATSKLSCVAVHRPRKMCFQTQSYGPLHGAAQRRETNS